MHQMILYINTDSRRNHSDTNRYTFSLASDIAVEKSCLFHIELKYLINNFFNFSLFHHGTIIRTYYMFVLYIIVPCRLVYSLFFDIRGNLGDGKEKRFLPFTDRRNPTILV